MIAIDRYHRPNSDRCWRVVWIRTRARLARLPSRDTSVGSGKALFEARVGHPHRGELVAPRLAALPGPAGPAACREPRDVPQWAGAAEKEAPCACATRAELLHSSRVREAHLLPWHSADPTFFLAGVNVDPLLLHAPRGVVVAARCARARVAVVEGLQLAALTRVARPRGRCAGRRPEGPYLQCLSDATPRRARRRQAPQRPAEPRRANARPRRANARPRSATARRRSEPR